MKEIILTKNKDNDFVGLEVIKDFKKDVSVFNTYDSIQIFKDDIKLHSRIVETMYALLMRDDKVLFVLQLGKGGTNFVDFTLKELVIATILTNCTNVIVAHNHPSGHIETLNEDDENARNLISNLLSYFDAQLLDFIIVSNSNAKSHMS